MEWFFPRWWLVEDAGRLAFAAVQHCWWTGGANFYVYRWYEELGVWRRIRSFGDRALFVGRGTAFFANAGTCRGDRVYFTDDERVCPGESVAVQCYEMQSREGRYTRSLTLGPR